MLLTRWAPFNDSWRELNRLQDEMNRLFDRFGVERGLPATAEFPALNVWEDANTLFAEAELPGMELKDLEIFVTGDQLTIRGERRPPALEQATWHRQERGFGQFSRVMTLPFAVDADRVSAEFVNGVLTISMPKSEHAKPKKITVKAE